MSWQAGHVAEFPYIYVHNAIAVCVIITGVTHPIPVSIFLARVWHKHTVILKKQVKKSHFLSLKDGLQR